jgi:nucleoside-diphosphate-sugar epimerase
VAEADDGGEVEVWGDGEQTRSFLYIDECLEGTVRLMRSDCRDVLNIGSDEMVSISGLAAMIAKVANKNLRLKHVPGPLGVRGRNSDNKLIARKLGWKPSEPLIRGIEKTYRWIAKQVRIAKQRNDAA